MVNVGKYTSSIERLGRQGRHHCIGPLARTSCQTCVFLKDGNFFLGTSKNEMSSPEAVW